MRFGYSRHKCCFQGKRKIVDKMNSKHLKHVTPLLNLILNYLVHTLKQIIIYIFILILIPKLIGILSYYLIRIN